jgi:hypothetical protein
LREIFHGVSALGFNGSLSMFAPPFIHFGSTAPPSVQIQTQQANKMQQANHPRTGQLLMDDDYSRACSSTIINRINLQSQPTNNASQGTLVLSKSNQHTLGQSLVRKQTQFQNEVS